MFRHRLGHIARHQIVERGDTAARAPCRKQLVLAVIERQRQHRERHVVAAQLEVMRHADRAQPQVRMAQHHAFGLAGRPAGIEDRGDGLRIGGRFGQRIASFRRLQRRAFLYLRAPGGQIALLQRGKPRGCADQHGSAAVRQNMRDLRALEHRVDRHVDQPGTRRGQRQQAGQLALGGPARDPRARFRNLRFQPARQPTDTGS